MRAWLSRLFRPESGIFIAFVLVFLMFGRTRFFQDPGTYWHIVLGQNLLATGQFTQADQFTFTFEGRPWLALQWLGECAMALVFQTGQWDLLLLSSVVLLAALYTWIASRLMRNGLHWTPTVLLLVVVVGAGTHHFHVRPHLASIVGLAVTFATLIDVENGRRSPRGLWILVPLFLVWTNVHGGVLAGWVTVVMALAGWCGAGLLFKSGEGNQADWFAAPRRAATIRAVMVAIALGLCMLVNPYGIAAPRAWVTIMSMPLPEMIDEHRALSLTTPEGIMTATLAMIYLICLLDAARRKRRVVWFLPLIWMLLAYSRVRHAPLFSVVASLAIADILPHTRLSLRLAKTECFYPDPPRRTWASAVWAALVPAGVLGLVLGLQLGGIRVPVLGSGWAHPGEDRWPTTLVGDLRQLAHQQNPPRIFNELDFGGFLTFYAPRWKTFIDDRCELFGADFLAEYLAAYDDPHRIDAWVQKYRFQAALIRTGSPIDRYLADSPDWELLRQDTAGSLYLWKHP